MLAVDSRASKFKRPTNRAAEAGSVNEASSVVARSSAVGYAVLRDSCVVEMFTLPEHPRARPLLLARACREALDRGHHSVSLLTSATDPLHEIMVTAGGQWIRHDATRDGIWMYKLLTPDKWISKLYPVLHRRAQEAGINRPIECCLQFPDGGAQFTLTRRSARLAARCEKGADAACSRRDLQQLLASNLRPGEIEFPEPLAAAMHRLFPLEFFWRSTFEWLRL